MRREFSPERSDTIDAFLGGFCHYSAETRGFSLRAGNSAAALTAAGREGGRCAGDETRVRSMRRWNGWGEETIEAQLPDAGRDFLRERIGETAAPNDAALAEVLAGVRPSRLPDHRLVSRDAEARLRASLGQSLEDWLRLRFGRLGPVVDGVAFPETEDEVRELMEWAGAIGAIAIPVGGATSVVGHLTPGRGESPSLAIVMTRLRRLIRLDPLSELATFEAGVTGPDLEAQLRADGFITRSLSAKLRLLDARRVDRHPLVRPAVGALWTDRGAVRRRADRDADRRARNPDFPRLGRRPGPAPMGSGIGRPDRNPHPRHDAGRAACRSARRSSALSCRPGKKARGRRANWRKEGSACR